MTIATSPPKLSAASPLPRDGSAPAVRVAPLSAAAPALTPSPGARVAFTPSPGSLPAFTPAPGTLPALTPSPVAVPALTPGLGALPALTPIPGLRRAEPGAPVGKVKGTLVISRMKYLRARGEDDAERVLRRMSAADQAVLRGMLLPSSWYAGDLVLRLEMTTVALLARGDRRELFLDMGRFTADTNLGPGGVQRPYLEEGDPHHLLRNVPRMYAAQHAGGVRTYEPLEGKAAVIRTTAGEEPNHEDCLTAVGWLKRAIELSGGRIVTVEEPRCRAFGAAACEYVCRWA